MHPVSTALVDTLERDVGLEMYSRVVAEWELNAYHETTITGSSSTDDELFPLGSIILPRRPVRTGLPKFIVNQSRVTNDSRHPKYRVASEDSNYKYFHSNDTTRANRIFASPVTVTVAYADPVPCNKFVVGFEQSFSTPTSVQLLVTYNGIDWVNAGYHSPNADGLISLWLQENGTWGTTSTLYEENHTPVRGWRVRVEEMSQANRGVGIIQVSPRLAMDLTNRVIDASTARSREDFNLTSPVGTSSSTTSDIHLANDDRLFDPENAASPLQNLIDRNVRFDVSIITVRRDGISEGVPQGTFFADEWSASSDGTVSVSASDRSKFLQETIVENSFYWNKSAEVVVRDILDRFGHPSYVVRYTTADANRRIPYVFFKNEETVWDALQSLAIAEQASFYFDEQDRFVWESRDFTWETSSAHWTLRNDYSGTRLPNIIEWNPRFEVGANKVNIKYAKLSPATSGGEVINNVVWEESSPLVLNSSVMRSDLPVGQMAVRIDPEDGPFWPEFGILNIGGEYMAYEKDPSVEGRLVLTERGLYGSTIKAHRRNTLDNNGRFRAARKLAGTANYEKIWENSRFGSHRIRDSYVQLEMPGGQSFWNTGHYFLGELGNAYAYYGCELIFPVSQTGMGEPFYDGEGVAGMFLHNDGDWNGYYFELVTTQFATSAADRKAEVRAWRRSAGVERFIGKPDNQAIYPAEGRLFDVVPGRPYRLDILSRRTEGLNHFNVFVNGVAVLDFTDTAPGAKRTTGYWGVYARAKTVARFEAAWAMASPLGNDELLSLYPTLRDRANGGFVSGLLEDSWRKMNRSNTAVRFEDFGPVVHGGQEYHVDYEIAPNVATDLFVSNDNDTFVVYHKRDPFSSKFAIMNASRDDAVVVGADPSRDNQQMSLFIYGRPIVEEDESSISREDTPARRRRGLEEFELSSPWVQTKERAERIADWLVERWGRANDVVEVDVVVIPHLQLGDLVEIDAPSENLYPSTHRYNVVGIDRTVGTSHSMSVTLRRRR